METLLFMVWHLKAAKNPCLMIFANKHLLAFITHFIGMVKFKASYRLITIHPTDKKAGIFVASFKNVSISKIKPCYAINSKSLFVTIHEFGP